MQDLINSINNLSIPSYFDWVAYIIIPVLIMILNIWLVNKNTNKQISNQNKETYKPRLRLVNFKTSKNFIDEYCYHAVCKNVVGDNNDNYISTKLKLENIGNGLAQDISFYTLNNGEECCRSMSIEESINQKNFSTEEIPKDKSELFNFNITYNPNVNIEPMMEKDFCLIICNYKDLNNNDYKLLLGYIIKKEFIIENPDEHGELENDVRVDTYYYQEGTDAYNHMISKNIDNYNKILKNINSNNFNICKKS